MANRRPSGGRRMDFVRNDRVKNFRPGVSPWQGGAPGNDIPNLLPLGSGSTEATLALASNIINLLQPRQNPVPSLLDMPIRRDFGPPMGRYDRGYPPNRMNNQGNFRRTGNYNRSGERINSNRKPFRPNDGQRQQTKGSPKKEADSKNKPKESEQEGEKSQEAEKSQVKQEEKSGQKTRYDDINPQLLKCHICNKSMWDGRSFENHLSGRAHAIMMQKTAESYALTADTMRQEFKIREMKRTRKSGQQPMRDFYCAMCLMYAADGSGHRTTVGHRKLKKYLHPTCTACHKEMPTRIELDEHRLTPEHLKMMQDKQDVGGKPKPEGRIKKKDLPAPWLTDDLKTLLSEKKLLKAKMKSGKEEDVERYRQVRNRCNALCRDAQRRHEVMMISSLQSEQLYLRDDRDRQRYKKPAEDKDKSTQDKDKDACQEGDEKAAEGDPEEKAEELKEELDKEDTILDYTEGDDIVNISNDRYPAYSTERGVGRSFLSEFKCYQCLLCKKLLDSEETAEVHLRTWRHHQLFVRLLNEKSGKEGTDENDNLIDDTTELESPTNIISLDISPENQRRTRSKRRKYRNKNGNYWAKRDRGYRRGGYQITDRETSKRPIKTEDSGNWKRRKTSPDPDENDDHTENGHDIEVEEKNKEEMKEMAPASEQGIPKDDELEDWGQSVEEFLDNFKPEELKEDDTDDIDDILEEERKQEDLKEENEKKEDDSETFANNEENDNANTVSRPRSSPRRGRGRRRN